MSNLEPDASPTSSKMWHQHIKRIFDFNLSSNINPFARQYHALPGYQKYLDESIKGNWLQYNYRALIPMYYLFYKMYKEFFLIAFIFGYLLGLNIFLGIVFFFFQPFLFYKLFEIKSNNTYDTVLKKYNKYLVKYAKEIKYLQTLKTLSIKEKKKFIKNNYIKIPYDYLSLDPVVIYTKKLHPVFWSTLPLHIIYVIISVYVVIWGASFNYTASANFLRLLSHEFDYINTTPIAKNENEVIMLDSLSKLANFPSTINSKNALYIYKIREEKKP